MLGENIKKKRIESHLTQQQLADLLGLKDRSSITKIEKGLTHLSENKLITLANILNTTVEYLVSGNVSSAANIYHGTMVKDLPAFQTNKHKKHVGIILAGGKYRVNKQQIPYQFVTVNDKPIIIYTMETYQKHPLINDIYVVCVDEWQDFLETYANQYNISKLKGIIPAGTSGVMSIKNAVEWIAKKYRAEDIILLQEATRPLIDPESISNTIRCCSKFGSAVNYTYLEDTTPFLLSKDKSSVTPLDAYSLITIQSPEAYTLGALKYAFIEASKDGHVMSETICAVFMHNIGVHITFCEGNHNNLRIVYEEDLQLFRALQK